MTGMSSSVSSASAAELAELENVWISSTVTVKRYREMKNAADRYGLSDFIQERLSERYVIPLRPSLGIRRTGF